MGGVCGTHGENINALLSLGG